jgi:heme/copper-type cytochrome/quinol oxidase subunit 2
MRRWLMALPFGLLAALVLALPIPALAHPQIRHLTLDLSQYAFSPGRVQVNAGDTVILTLKADDVVHGFYLDGYGIKQRVEPGIDQQINFVADRRGKFRYRCSVTCGPLHPFMIGELVVGPNLFVWRAIGVTLVAFTGLFVNQAWTRHTGIKELESYEQ